MSETPEQLQAEIAELQEKLADAEKVEAEVPAQIAELTAEEEKTVAAVLGNVVPQVPVEAPKIEALPVKHILVPPATRAVPIRDARQTIPAVRPLQPLER